MEQDVIVSEALPFKFGNYCDTFIGFHRDLGAELTFCSCQCDAINRHLEICRIYEKATQQGEQLPWFVCSRSDYPGALWKEASFLFETVPLHVLPRLMRFADDLCHRCNQRMPYGYYAFSDSASGYFISHFRPYVNQACYAVGITPTGHIVLADACPEPIKALELNARRDAIEAGVRQAFGFPPKGINRNQESKLSLLVGQILPDCKIRRHYRPSWLEGLELDLFVEEHNVGIEFQGKQHSEAFAHLGGELALRNTQRRDKKKARLCKAQAVKLLLFEEGDDLSEDTVRGKLRIAIPLVGSGIRQRIERPPYDFFVPVEGATLRMTYHDEKDELSLSGQVGGAELFANGKGFDLTVSCEAERVVSVHFCVRKQGESTAMTFRTSADEPQLISFGNNTYRPMLEFFKVWSMFNPRVVVRQCRLAE